jgi:hypothetical protein
LFPISLHQPKLNACPRAAVNGKGSKAEKIGLNPIGIGM